MSSTRFGLQPENVPERVAREKMIEELIDRILERSYLSMADLRDALSKNDLKLPDVAGLEDFLRGDRLLKADRACSDALEGVYRRGAVYQRWPQMLSSLAFGTRTGRFLTQFVAVPYGGAYLALECLRHLGHYSASGNGGADSLAQHVSTLPSRPRVDRLAVGGGGALPGDVDFLAGPSAFLSAMERVAAEVVRAVCSEMVCRLSGGSRAIEVRPANSRQLRLLRRAGLRTPTGPLNCFPGHSCPSCSVSSGVTASCWK